MADINVNANVQRTSTLGKVRILVEQVAGSPSQAQISQAVADYIDSHPGALSPLSQATKSALLDIAAHVAYIDANGQSRYNALDAALNAKALLSITAVYTQSGTVYDDDSLDSLKSDLVVTAYYDDGTSADVTSACTLSGTLAEGTSTITATYSGKTATFNVTVSVPLYSLPNVAETSVTAYGQTSTVKVENGLVTITGSVSQSIYITKNGTVTTTQPRNDPWFSAEIGSKVTNNPFDISWNATSGSNQSLGFKWANSEAAGNLVSASLPIDSASSGSNEETSFTADISVKRVYSALTFQWTNMPSTGGTVSFRIRVYVDGVRYF